MVPTNINNIIKHTACLSCLLLTFSAFGNYDHKKIETANKRVNCGNIVGADSYTSSYWVKHFRHNVHIAIDPDRPDTVRQRTSDLISEWIIDYNHIRTLTQCFFPSGACNTRSSYQSASWIMNTFFIPAQVRVPNYQPQNALHELPQPLDFDNYITANITGNFGKDRYYWNDTKFLTLPILYQL